MKRACELLGKLIDDYPESELYRREYGLVAADTAAALNILGRYNEAAEFCEQALMRCPDEDPILTTMARSLASRSDQDSETYQRAVRKAERAVQLAPNEAEAWNALGMARYRLGMLQEAVSALNTSVTLRDGGDPWDWFFLAMAEHQRGNLEASQEWYDKAVAWTKSQNSRTQFRVRLISAEAASMLDTGSPSN